MSSTTNTTSNSNNTTAAPPTTAAPTPALHQPKLVLLVHPNKESHGLVQRLRSHADVVKSSGHIEPADVVFSHRNRSIGLLLLSSHELQQPNLLPAVVARIEDFQTKSSQHPIAVLISPTRDRTPPAWFTLQEEVKASGRLTFLLANSLDDATAAVSEVVNSMKDEQKRVRQNEYFNSLIKGASSPGTAEMVLRRLFSETLGLDEKELWRILAGPYGTLSQMASAPLESLLEHCPIDRETGEKLCAFFDGVGVEGGGGGVQQQRGGGGGRGVNTNMMSWMGGEFQPQQVSQVRQEQQQQQQQAPQQRPSYYY